MTKTAALASLTAIDKTVTAARALVNGKKVDPAQVLVALDRTDAALNTARSSAGAYRK